MYVICICTHALFESSYFCDLVIYIMYAYYKYNHFSIYNFSINVYIRKGLLRKKFFRSYYRILGVRSCMPKSPSIHQTAPTHSGKPRGHVEPESQSFCIYLAIVPAPVPVLVLWGDPATAKVESNPAILNPFNWINNRNNWIGPNLWNIYMFFRLPSVRNDGIPCSRVYW